MKCGTLIAGKRILAINTETIPLTNKMWNCNVNGKFATEYKRYKNITRFLWLKQQLPDKVHHRMVAEEKTRDNLLISHADFEE